MDRETSRENSSESNKGKDFHRLMLQRHCCCKVCAVTVGAVSDSDSHGGIRSCVLLDKIDFVPTVLLRLW